MSLHERLNQSDYRAQKQQYLLGFGLSLVLTFGAYILAANHILQGGQLAITIIGLALVQVVVQLLFFLHLRHESEPRWKLLTFDFMLIILAILVVGTLWIMQNLDYNMMPAEQTDEHIIKDEGYRR